jgi:hypothetical protein
MSPQLKERPAAMLRAVFGGLGSLLAVMDKVRSRPRVQVLAGAAAGPAAEPALAAAEAAAGPVEPAPAAGLEPPPEPETATAPLPLANYDELSVASLRARLRTLSVPQLTQLLDYERGQAARADVIAMFERRIAKVQAEA